MATNYYSVENLARLTRGLHGVEGKYEDLMFSYITHNYSTPGGKEFAHHGFMRRLKVMTRCISAIFKALPPEQTDVPDGVLVADATIALQSFIFNVSGAVDNLAWVLVKERGIIRLGRPLTPTFVGLRSKNVEVRQALSKKFQVALGGFQTWFTYIDNYRHALAHRIPLYIPPHCVDPRREVEYRDLEKRQQEALRNRDVDLHDRLIAEQAKLTFFRPWMTHSYSEKTEPVPFHAQILNDFLSVEELAWLTLDEIGGVRKKIPFRWPASAM